MIRENKNMLVLLIIGITLSTPFILLSLKIQFSNVFFSESYSENNRPNQQNSNNKIITNNFVDVDLQSIIEIENGTIYHANYISRGEREYFVLKNVSFYSALYRIQGVELNPYFMDIDIYIKFGSVPTLIDYDYKMQTNFDYEIIDIEIPNEYEFGNIYITVDCVWGSGNYDIYAHCIEDNNGCWRNAEYIGNPIYLTGNISITNSLGSMDINDFYKIYINSGQIILIDFNVLTSGICNVELNLYDENHDIVVCKDSGSNLNLKFTNTDFYSGFYFIHFRNPDKSFQLYNGTISDVNTDSNNRFSDAQLLSPSLFTGYMNTKDINDYYYFMADSGEYINIQILIIDTLDSPHYDAFLYINNEPINDLYYKSATQGTTLDIEFQCQGLSTNEVFPFVGNKIYLRLWNAANFEVTPDSTSTYLINITKSWSSTNDRLLTAPPFTNFGNDTTLKNGKLDKQNNINDWFKITTKVGYTITISANYTNPIPYNILRGYLIDNAGNIVISDISSNISLSYTSQYDGEYFFRFYGAFFQNNCSCLNSISYFWFIYTSSKDVNNDFLHADSINPNLIIESYVSKSDVDDYYIIEITSGSQININGGGLLNLELYLYNSSYFEVDLDILSPWSIEYQHKGSSSEYYYILVKNNAIHDLAYYTFNITTSNIDPEGDNTLNTAKYLVISTGETINGGNSIGDSDINDYFKFKTTAGDKILINITGNYGLLTRLSIKDNCDNEFVLEENLNINSNTSIIEYYSKSYSNNDFYYFRVCAPQGLPHSYYSWSLSLIEYDTDDGYRTYANILDIDSFITSSSTLSINDTNDWYILRLPSGSSMNVKIQTIGNEETCIGVQFSDIFSLRETYSKKIELEFNYNNSYSFSHPVYFRIVNELLKSVNYTIKIYISYIDNDNNGALELANNPPIDYNIIESLGIDDFNDYYIIEIKSGYNLSVIFDLFDTPTKCLTLLLWDDKGTLLATYMGNNGFITYTNSEFNSTTAYLQFTYFQNKFVLNNNEINYLFKISLYINDPDGDFDIAFNLNRKLSIINDTLYANTINSDYSDINDFYSLKLWRNNELKLNISLNNIDDLFLGIGIYDSNKNILAFSIINDTQDFSIVCYNSGYYYIRLYDITLSTCDYTVIVNAIRNNAFLKFNGILAVIFALIICSFIFTITKFISSKKKQSGDLNNKN